MNFALRKQLPLQIKKLLRNHGYLKVKYEVLRNKKKNYTTISLEKEPS